MKQYRAAALVALVVLIVLGMGSCELLWNLLVNPLDGISVGTGEAYLLPGETGVFDVVSSPADASLELSAVSDAPEVAFVSGIDSETKKLSVTANALGTAIITVSEGVYGYEAELAVTVTWDIPQSLTLSATSLSLTGGALETLTASIIPAQASQSVIWESSNPSVASVSSAGTSIGSVRGTGAGTATITARSAGRLEVAASCSVTVTEPAKKASWTIMYYGDADNNLEGLMLDDMEEMKDGLREDADINLIALFDRIGGYSEDSAILYEDFTGTRLYRILPGASGGLGTAFRLDGGSQLPGLDTSGDVELNMGDVAILDAFIDFCKANYPATNYALIFSNHGSGSKSVEAEAPRSKAICYDETSDNDTLYTAELTDGLDGSHAVQLLVYDACLMGTVEVAYQYEYVDLDHFYADFMAASAPSLWGYGLPYAAVLDRLRTGGGDNGTADATLGGNEAYLAPAALTALDFGALIVEEQRDSLAGESSQSFSFYDLSKTQALKDAVDALASQLAAEDEKADLEALRGSGTTVPTMHYFDQDSEDEWAAYAYFDLYDLCVRIIESADFSADVRNLAGAAAAAADAFVIHSFAGTDFRSFVDGSLANDYPFSEGQNGVSIFFPDGDRPVDVGGDLMPMWATQYWYSPRDLTLVDPDNSYGKLDWCIYGFRATPGSGRTEGDGIIDNWFELLDLWFDDASDWNGVAP